ncbi:MAG TPA: HAD hydrolase-like protein [Pyrinomonadaceae bacterium]|nr:HAD hydrolase-like protein [Pyrinomonadaceae bacterium]
MRLYRQRFVSSGLYQNRVYDGIPALLEQVSKSDVATFAATSKPAEYAERIVQHFELSHHFQKVYGSDLDGRFDDKAELIAYLLASEGRRALPSVGFWHGHKRIDGRHKRSVRQRRFSLLRGPRIAEEATDGRQCSY